MTADFNPIVDARLSIQRAMLGEVTSELRVAAFSVSGLSLDVRFYYDGEISEKDIESVSCVETEILADYPPEHTVTASYIRLDHTNFNA